jgi:hypothetical protein
MMRNRLAMLTALGVDNFGSGLFLPLNFPPRRRSPCADAAHLVPY